MWDRNHGTKAGMIKCPVIMYVETVVLRYHAEKHYAQNALK
jgi:hypothetical protein